MFNYKWQLKDGYPAPGVEKHGLKVYSTFACGGGSTMGYKLAGYDVIGANDIDPQMAKVYKENHHPKFYDLCPIGDLLNKELPEEYYNLDILDGSPPCSTFSMAGQREKSWKKDKQFREGQAKQVLSDLFFDWIALVDKLKPKIAIAENVKGMLIGNAKAYTKRIIEELNAIGYDVQLFLLNGATMGVPQARERVFFVCKKRSLELSELNLEFTERNILFAAINQGKVSAKELTPLYKSYWQRARPGDAVGIQNTAKKVRLDKPLPTLHTGILYHPIEMRGLCDIEYCLGGSYPIDYNFMDVQPRYLIGMSVPPIMMAQVAYQVYQQLLK